jgi:hypothetical protein
MNCAGNGGATTGTRSSAAARSSITTRSPTAIARWAKGSASGCSQTT